MVYADGETALATEDVKIVQACRRQHPLLRTKYLALVTESCQCLLHIGRKSNYFICGNDSSQPERIAIFPVVGDCGLVVVYKAHCIKAGVHGLPGGIHGPWKFFFK